LKNKKLIKKISLSFYQIRKSVCLPLSKKMIIDIIVNKNPDGFCINEKIEKTMAQDGDF